MTARKKTPSAKPTPAKKPTAVRTSKKPSTKIKTAAPLAKAAVSASKAVGAKKAKLIRDSFTMPSFDYDLIKTLKIKGLASKTIIKKNELLRAGLHALSKLDSSKLIALVGTLAAVKTARPKK